MEIYDVLRSKIRDYKWASPYFTGLFWAAETLSLLFMIATPLLLIASQFSRSTTVETANSRPSPTSLAGSKRTAEQKEKIGKNPNIGTPSTDGNTNHLSTGADTPTPTLKGIINDWSTEAATFTSVAAIMAGLAKKYGWENHIILNKKTAEAIEFELNTLEAQGDLDEHSMREVLKRVHGIEKKHLAYWEKDIEESES